MTIVKRTGLGRAMTWSELDGNWDQVVESTAAAQQSAALAAASQTAAAASATSAAQSASDAANQAEATATLRTDLASTDAGKGLSLVSAEDGTNGQTFFDDADQFAGAYEAAIITIKSANRWITYNGSRWYVKPGVTLPIITTGLNASSWATDSENFTNSANVLGAELSSPDGFSLIGQVTSFAALRTLTPSSAGQRVFLASWNENVTPYGQASFGSGQFVAVSGSGTDDGGFVAKVSDTWYWQRVKDVTEATIQDFGGIPDGSTLVDDALVRMFVWAYGTTAQSNVDSLETTVKENQGIVRFGPGQFAIGNVDLTSYGRKNGVKFYGDLTGDYKNLKTTIYTTQTSGYAITAYFLQCEMTGFNVIGQYDTDASDTCGFLDNQYAGAPQQFRARAFHIQNVGGRIFNLTDTMDTEITQIYMENGTSTLVYNKWSGNTSGEWDHTTAVALRDISVWNIKTNSVLFIPRCHQSEICNVWISGCDKPGNISQGDWKFSGVLQLEGNAEDFYAQEAHIVGFEPGTQGTYGISYTAGSSEIPTSWDDNSMGVPDYVTDPSWERGRTYITPTGLEVYYGAVQTNYYASRNSIRNDGADPLWHYIGDLYIPSIGQSCLVEIFGTGGYNDASSSTPLMHTYDSGFGGGRAEIYVQNKDGTKLQVSWHGVNSTPVTAVKYTGSGQYISLFAQIAAYSPSQSVFVKTDAPARTDAGLHFKFDYNGKEIDITTVSSPKDASCRFMVSNGASGGFGVDMDNGSLVAGVTLTAPSATATLTTGIPMYIDGTKYIIPLMQG
mgnify:CR=1 FL=1